MVEEEGLMVAKVLGIGREMDGWNDLVCGERVGGHMSKGVNFVILWKRY